MNVLQCGLKESNFQNVKGETQLVKAIAQSYKFESDIFLTVTIIKKWPYFWVQNQKQELYLNTFL